MHNPKIRPFAFCMKILAYFIMLIIFVVSILPLIWIFLSSFKTNAEILNAPLAMPSHWGLAGYRAAFKIAPLSKFYINSLIITGASTVLNIFFVSLSAYAVARFDFKMKPFIFALFSFSLLIPMTTLIHPVYLLINAFHLTNTKAGLIFVYISLGFPTTFFIMRGYFLSIPKSIEEAAQIDGANFFQCYFRVVFPIAKPGLATSAILQFLMAWNEFLYALILTTSVNARTLPLATSYFTSQFSFNYTAMFAAITMIVLPSIVIYMLMQKQVVGSLTAGSVKG